MTLVSALSAAMSGLRATQAGLSLVSQNVANAQTPGYTRKVITPVAQIAGDRVVGVRTSQAQRQIDAILQRTLRTESAGASYAAARGDMAGRLDALYGPPDSSSALTTLYDDFTTALGAAAASPENGTARAAALGKAGVLAQRLNGIAADIQGLRDETEQRLSNGVDAANGALQRLQTLDRQIVAETAKGNEPANLLDQRDQAIADLSKLMDVRVIANSDNSVSVSTRSGTLLYDRQAVTLAFDARAPLSAQSRYDVDPAKRGVGTISIKGANGAATDLLAQDAFRSGELGGLLSLRDDLLPEAQAQLDELAAGMARALSDKPVAGSAVSVGAQSGFAVDVSALKPGDSIALDVVENGVARRVSIVRVDDASKLPLPGSATAAAGDQVIGVSFAGGASAAAAAIQGALGGGFAVSASGSTLRFLDDGAAGTTDVSAASATVTEAALSGGGAALPFFVDGSAAYSGSLDGAGQKTGFSRRIAVNPALVADSSKLVAMTPATASGDATRLNAIIDRLTGAARTFGGDTGLGTDDAPANGTITGYLQRIVAYQGQQSQTASQLAAGQDVVVSGLQARFDESAKVNIDEEMARLIELQQSFQASARIISAVDDMMKQLLQLV